MNILPPSPPSPHQVHLLGYIFHDENLTSLPPLPLEPLLFHLQLHRRSVPSPDGVCHCWKTPGTKKAPQWAFLCQDKNQRLQPEHIFIFRSFLDKFNNSICQQKRGIFTHTNIPARMKFCTTLTNNNATRVNFFVKYFYTESFTLNRPRVLPPLFYVLRYLLSDRPTAMPVIYPVYHCCGSVVCASAGDGI